jgi:hypothetical protein
MKKNNVFGTICSQQQINKTGKFLPAAFVGTEQLWTIALYFLAYVSSTQNWLERSVQKKYRY